MLEDPPVGTHIVSASAPGYIGASAEVNVVIGFEATADFSLEPIPLPITTFPPTDDALVKSSQPTKNYGLLDYIRLRAGSPTYHSYLQFHVTGLGGAVQTARVRLYVTDGSNDGGQLYAVANGWEESTITWDNAPLLGASPIAGVATVASGSWVEFDVSTAITGDGIYSFGLMNASSNSVYYSSKEGANPPELVVEVDGSPLSLPDVIISEIDPGDPIELSNTTAIDIDLSMAP